MFYDARAVASEGPRAIEKVCAANTAYTAGVYRVLVQCVLVLDASTHTQSAIKNTDVNPVLPAWCSRKSSRNCCPVPTTQQKQEAAHVGGPCKTAIMVRRGGAPGPIACAHATSRTSRCCLRTPFPAGLHQRCPLAAAALVWALEHGSTEETGGRLKVLEGGGFEAHGDLRNPVGFARHRSSAVQPLHASGPRLSAGANRRRMRVHVLRVHAGQ